MCSVKVKQVQHVNVKSFTFISEKTEAKLPLLWSHILLLCYRQCEYSLDPMVGVLTLRNLVQSVTQLLEHRAGAGWGILGAIGLVKSNLASNRFVLSMCFIYNSFFIETI